MLLPETVLEVESNRADNTVKITLNMKYDEYATINHEFGTGVEASQLLQMDNDTIKGTMTYEQVANGVPEPTKLEK